MRIAKFISGSGVCSRRQAENLIEQGRVKINSVIIDKPAINILEGDIVEVDGKKLHYNIVPRIWAYHKPVGLICTHSDPQGRVTIFEELKNKLPRVISVGRLDINSEGLLLLTNSGDLARYLESPKNKIDRIYKVRAFGNQRPINLLNKIIEVDGITYKPKSIKQTQSGHNSWYEVILTEGKNREIRRIFEHFGFEVNRLIRTSFGKYSLGDLKPGEFQEVQLDENYRW